MIIKALVFKRIVTRWLASNIRQRILLAKYRWIRRLKLSRNQKHKAEVYVALNDPYSFLLVQVLKDLTTRFDIEFELFITHGALLGRTDHKTLWLDWALQDAQALAQQYQLQKPRSYPTHQTLVSAQQQWQIQPKTIENAVYIFENAWSNSFDFQYLPSTPVINHQVKNLFRMVSKGYESAGSIYFAEQWYWGIDSLEHLERIFTQMGLKRPQNECDSKENRREEEAYAASATDVFYNKSHLKLAPLDSQSNNSKKPDITKSQLEAFVSIRSPYSYLGLVQAKRLADVYGVGLVIKPILPILMRGGEISIDKQKYIFQDAAREAKVLGIPFKQLTDPIGEGVFNCYRYFGYVQSRNKAYDYMLAMFEAVFVDNIDLKVIKNVKRIFEQLDLSFSEANDYAQANDWQLMTDKNQLSLDEMGYWGVPCFVYEDSNCWGQDRLWQIEQAISNSIKEESADSPQ